MDPNNLLLVVYLFSWLDHDTAKRGGYSLKKIIRNGTIVTASDTFKADLQVNGETITAIAARIDPSPDDEVIVDDEAAEGRGCGDWSLYREDQPGSRALRNGTFGRSGWPARKRIHPE